MLRPLLLLLCLVAAPAAAAQDSLVVVVRVDDVQSRSAIGPRSIVPFEAAVEARGGRVSWVVIPHRLEESQNADGTLAAELALSAARGHEIALHGYTHICPRCGESGHELWCARDRVALGAAVQQRLLGDGLALLRTRLGADRVTAAVPPGHYGDRATFRLLAERGVTALSLPPLYEDSLAAGQVNLRTSEDFGWNLTPATYDAARTAALDDVRARGRAQGYYVLLVHDPFTRPGYQNGLLARWTGEVMDSIAVLMDGRVVYETLSGAARRLRQATATLSSPAPAALAARVWPNPSAGAARLWVEGAAPSAALHVTVFDAMGRDVQRFVLAPGVQQAPFDAASLAPGAYVVRVVQGRAMATLPLTVIR